MKKVLIKLMLTLSLIISLSGCAELLAALEEINQQQQSQNSYHSVSQRCTGGTVTSNGSGGYYCKYSNPAPSSRPKTSGSSCPAMDDPRCKLPDVHCVCPA